MAQALSELSKTDLADRWSRAKTTIANMRAEGEAIANRGVTQMLGIAGGAAVGFMRGYYGDEEDGNVYIPGTEVDADLALYGVTAVVALTGIAGKSSDQVNAFSTGMGGALGARYAEKAARKWKEG